MFVRQGVSFTEANGRISMSFEPSLKGLKVSLEPRLEMLWSSGRPGNSCDCRQVETKQSKTHLAPPCSMNPSSCREVPGFCVSAMSFPTKRTNGFETVMSLWGECREQRMSRMGLKKQVGSAQWSCRKSMKLKNRSCTLLPATPSWSGPSVELSRYRSDVNCAVLL